MTARHGLPPSRSCCSDETLSPEPMRERAHLRWTIENHPFRALKAAVHSKHVWTRGKQAEQTWERLMLRLLMFLAFTLVLAYHGRLDPEELSEILGIRYGTLGYRMEWSAGCGRCFPWQRGYSRRPAEVGPDPAR